MMTQMRKYPSEQRVRGALLLLILVASLAIVCAFVVLAYLQTPQARSRRNPAGSLVGIWVGEQGNLIDIRSDGTGRARSDVNDTDVGYFEWTLDSGEFAIYQYAAKYNLGWFVRRAMMDDTPTTRFDVIEVTPTGLKLRTEAGETLTFYSALDGYLEKTQ